MVQWCHRKLESNCCTWWLDVFSQHFLYRIIVYFCRKWSVLVATVSFKTFGWCSQTSYRKYKQLVWRCSTRALFFYRLYENRTAGGIILSWTFCFPGLLTNLLRCCQWPSGCSVQFRVTLAFIFENSLTSKTKCTYWLLSWTVCSSIFYSSFNWFN